MAHGSRSHVRWQPFQPRPVRDRIRSPPGAGISRPPPGRHMALVSLRRPLGNWARRPRPWFVVPEAGSGSPGGGAQSPAGRSTTAWFAFRGATAPRPRWTQRQARPHGAGQPAQAARKLGAPARPWFVVPEAGSGSPGGGAQSPAGRSTTAAALRSPPRRNPGRLTAATWRWSDRSEVGGQALSPPRAWFDVPRGAPRCALERRRAAGDDQHELDQAPTTAPAARSLPSAGRPRPALDGPTAAGRTSAGSRSSRAQPGAGDRNRLQAGRPRPAALRSPRGGIPAASRPPRGAGQTARKWAVRRCPRREPGSTFHGPRLDVRSSAGAALVRRPRGRIRSPGGGAQSPAGRSTTARRAPESRPPHGRHVALVRPLGSGRSALVRPLGSGRSGRRSCRPRPPAALRSPRGGIPACLTAATWALVRPLGSGRSGGLVRPSAGRAAVPAAPSPRPDPGARAGERNRLQAGRSRPPRSGVPEAGDPGRLTAATWRWSDRSEVGAVPPRRWGSPRPAMNQHELDQAPTTAPRRGPWFAFRGAYRARPRWRTAAGRTSSMSAGSRSSRAQSEAGSGSPGGGAQSPAGRSTTAAALRSPRGGIPACLTAATWRWSDRSEVGGQAAWFDLPRGARLDVRARAAPRPRPPSMAHGRMALVSLRRPLGNWARRRGPGSSSPRPDPEPGRGSRNRLQAGRPRPAALRSPRGGIPAASRPPRGAGQTARKWAVGAGQTARKWAVRAQVLSTTAAGGAPESPRRDPGLPHGRHMGAGQTARKWAVRRLGSTFRGARSRSSRAQSEAGSGSPGGGAQSPAGRSITAAALRSPRGGGSRPPHGRHVALVRPLGSGRCPAAALGIAAAGDEPARAGPGADHGPPARSLVRLPRGLPRPPSMAHGSRSHVVDVRWQPFQPRPVRGRIREPGRGSAIACRPVDHGRRAPESPRRDPGLPHGRHMALVRPLGSGRSGGLVRPSAGRAPRCARSSGAATAPALDGARPHGAGQPAQAARKLGAPARPWFVVPEAGSGARAGKP